jgi:DNA-binding winged helix-turn-helix (wHTH) protein
MARYRLGIDAPTISSVDDRTFLGDGFSYLAKTGTLYFHDSPIQLGKKEASLLRLLINARGQVVDFATIDNVVWSAGYVDDNTRRTLVYRLRCKLNYTNIPTIPRVGYKINIEK